MLFLGFEGLLRTGELFSLWCENLVVICGHLVVRLIQTKTGQQFGADQVVVIKSRIVVAVMNKFLGKLQLGDLLLCRYPAAARQDSQQLLEFFDLGNCAFGWYSCRRGGASELFRRTGSMEYTLIQGRWANSRIARLHIETGLAECVSFSVAPVQQRLFSLFAPRLQAYIGA